YFDRFDWSEFSDEELDLVPPILVLAEAGTTTWEGVSKLLSMRFPVKIAVIDRHGLTVGVPDGSGTDLQGASAVGEELGLLALTRRDVFVLQTSVGHPGHLIHGVSEGLAGHAPALFYIHAPDPQTSGVAADETARQAELAYQSRLFPLFKFDPNRESPLSLTGNPDIDQTWMSHEQAVTEPSGSAATRDVPLTVADWAVRGTRFSEHFKIMSKGHRTAEMKTLAEYIELDAAGRGGLEPYIDVIDRRGRHVIAVVSPELVAATERKRDSWQYLKAVAGADAGSTVEQPVRAEPMPEAPAAGASQPAAELDESVYQRLTQRLLALAGYTEDPDYFKQSLRSFVTRGDNRNDGE
ncbi:MAG: hypothetical protein KAJ37_03870, partial [Candidatus Krumholzibacteria bacterium]|nr:hypothetical protein [Candidatus Krumholzibacteria bacterium]